MREARKTCRQAACLLAIACLCGVLSRAQVGSSFTDGNTEEAWQGTRVHVCPVGFAMQGAHVNNNVFTCVRVVPEGWERQVHTYLDRGTQGDLGRGNMHVCRPGWYMRGLHNDYDWLVCSDMPGVRRSFLDANGTTEGNGMHMCPISRDGFTVMTGIHNGRNDFACAGLAAGHDDHDDHDRHGDDHHRDDRPDQH